MLVCARARLCGADVPTRSLLTSFSRFLQAAASIGPLQEKAALAETLAKVTEKEAADAIKKLEDAEVKRRFPCAVTYRSGSKGCRC